MALVPTERFSDASVPDVVLWRSDGLWAKLPDIPADFVDIKLANAQETLTAGLVVCEDGCSRGRVEIWRFDESALEWARIDAGYEFRDGGPELVTRASSKWAEFEAWSSDRTLYLASADGHTRSISWFDLVPEDLDPASVGLSPCVADDEFFAVIAEVPPDQVNSAAEPEPAPPPTMLGVTRVELTDPESKPEFFAIDTQIPLPGLDHASCAANGIVMGAAGTQTVIRGPSSQTDDEDMVRQSTIDDASATLSEITSGSDSKTRFAIDPQTHMILMEGAAGHWEDTGMKGRALLSTGTSIVAATDSGFTEIQE